MKRTFSLILAFMLAITGLQAAERHRYNFNSAWKLSLGDDKNAMQANHNDSRWKTVTLPRAFNEDEAFRVAIDQHSDTVMWYRKHFSGKGLKGRKVLIEFEGIRQAGWFYINGEYLGLHENGVITVGFDISKHIKEGDNVIAVRIDNNWKYREQATNTTYQWNNSNFNANYGGIPKNVYLHVMDDVYQTLPLYSNLKTTGVYTYATDFDIKGRKATIHAESEVRNESPEARTLTYRATLKDMDGKVIKTFSGTPRRLNAGETVTLKAEARVADLHFWSWGYGYLYTVETELVDEKGTAFDKVSTRTGFRKTQFGEGKIWLNDRVLMVHGYAQRTSNEWPAVGLSVPAWLSDYSNGLVVEGCGNVVRWMHVTPWKQDIESCDRVGLIQAMPAGDAEKDRQGRQWEQRTELMRDAIIYNRNNPSILFYESGNESISREHMIEMKAIRDLYDPFGGRAIGSREMLDIKEAEYGGEMLYINKSKKHPMWATEYCRDEGMRKYWDEYSYPFHKEGDGPLYRGKPAHEYNHNSDMLTIEFVRRWYDYWQVRPGTGTRVSSGGVKIVFSDTNTHFRSEANYRLSGATDPMRIPKDGFFAHQVMWDGWVDPENSRTHIIGHWSYDDGVKKPVYVVSNGESVELLLNGKSLGKGKRSYNFLFTFDNVAFEEGTLTAISRDANGKEVSRHELKTAGKPARLVMRTIQNPEGFHADGADLALIEFEVVDKDGNRCPLDNRSVKFSISEPAEWRGGIAQGENNYILNTTLPVECGINRALIRSTTKAGKIKVTAQATDLPKASVTLQTIPVKVTDGKSDYMPSETLKGWLTRGETPSTPSYKDTKRGINIVSAQAGSNQENVRNSWDDNELSEWSSDGGMNSAWVTYTLERKARVSEVSLKLTSWRNKSYPLEILADGKVIWQGNTDKSLGYVHLRITDPVEADKFTIRLKGTADTADTYNQIGELAGGKTGELDNKKHGKHTLPIVEVDFIEEIK